MCRTGRALPAELSARAWILADLRLRVNDGNTRRARKRARELAGNILEVAGAGAPEVVPMHPRGRRPPCGCCACLSGTLLLRPLGARTTVATTCRGHAG